MSAGGAGYGGTVVGIGGSDCQALQGQAQQVADTSCQLDSDCGSNLRCCVANTTAAKAAGGICTVHLVDDNGTVLQDKCELATADVGPRLEARVREGGAKEAGVKEASVKEAGKVDLAADKTVTTPDKPPATPDAKTGQ